VLCCACLSRTERQVLIPSARASPPPAWR
jgi:hypothetical protein